MLRPVLITPPDILPVTLDEAKQQLRIDSGSTEDDALVKALIGTATEWLDGWTGILGRCLVEQKWRQDYDALAPCMPLPLGPVIEISAVEYIDEAGQPQALGPDAYTLRTDAGGRASLILLSWRQSQSASVTYKAGYRTIPEVPADGETPSEPAKTTVPMPIRAAIILLVRDLYASSHSAGVVKRETVADVGTTEYQASSTVVGQNPAVQALLAGYRQVGI